MFLLTDILASPILITLVNAPCKTPEQSHYTDDYLIGAIKLTTLISHMIQGNGAAFMYALFMFAKPCFFFFFFFF